MGSRPQTLYGIADSPVGLAAWLLDHNDADGQPAAAVASALDRTTSATGELTRDEILDNITLYWLTNTGVSASRLYWEYKGGFFNAKGVSIPVAVSVFPGEQYQAPRSWTERAYPNLIYYNKLDKGGHFAAWEQPELFAAEIRAASGSASSMTVFERLHMPSLGGATEWLNSEPLGRPTCAGTSSSSTSGRTRASTGSARSAVRPRVGREVPRRRAGRRRRPHAGVPVRDGMPTTFARRSRGARESSTRSRSTPTTRSGARSATGTGPPLYFVDAEGRIRHHQFGEGRVRDVRARHPAAAADVHGRRHPSSCPSKTSASRPRPTGTNLESPETYLGSTGAQLRVARRRHHRRALAPTRCRSG